MLLENLVNLNRIDIVVNELKHINRFVRFVIILLEIINIRLIKNIKKKNLNTKRNTEKIIKIK